LLPGFEFASTFDPYFYPPNSAKSVKLASFKQKNNNNTISNYNNNIMWSSTISPTNSKKLLIGSTRSVDYVGDSARTAAGNIKTGAAASAAAGAKGSKAKATAIAATAAAAANTTKISIEMELHIQNKCISA